MFHCSSDLASGGVPRGAPLGQGPCGPRRRSADAAAGGAGRGGFGAIHPRYCTPPLMLPVPFISILSSKSAASPPCQTRYTVPVGFSHVGSIVIAPSSTFQFESPDQPFSVLPSKSATQPSFDSNSIGSGCRKPPPPPPPPPAPPCPGALGAPCGGWPAWAWVGEAGGCSECAGVPTLKRANTTVVAGSAIIRDS